MVVDVLATWWVVLDNAIIVSPKQRLDLAHLIPGRTAILARDADMLPPQSIACDDAQSLLVLQFNDKAPIVLIACRVSSNLHTVLFWAFERHDHTAFLMIFTAHTRQIPSSVRSF